jgi:hypothetical protein
MALLEQHVGHLMASGVDAEPLELPDVAVAGVEVLAAHAHLFEGKGVNGDQLRRDTRPAAEAEHVMAPAGSSKLPCGSTALSAGSRFSNFAFSEYARQRNSPPLVRAATAQVVSHPVARTPDDRLWPPAELRLCLIRRAARHQVARLHSRGGSRAACAERRRSWLVCPMDASQSHLAVGRSARPGRQYAQWG